MFKVMLLVFVFYSSIYAGFMDSVGDIVESTLGDRKEKIPKVQTVGTLSVTTESNHEEESFIDSMVENVKKARSFDLPSVFGFNKKKEKKVFGSTMLGNTILGDVKATGTTFYRGFKNTGESTEFMSGMMYKSSKIYNEMFEMFDDSPLNIFDDKDEREPSVFDILDKGNKFLDILD